MAHLYISKYFILQVLYHVLGVAPAYKASIGPMLNELCLGLKPDELASVSPCLFLLTDVACVLYDILMLFFIIFHHI